MHCIVIEDISIGYYPTFMKYNQKKGETKMQMTAKKFKNESDVSGIKFNDSVFRLPPTRVLLRIQEAPLPTCRSNVAICISRTQACFVSTLYQLAVYLLGLGVLYKHCICMPCIGVGYIVSTLYQHTQCIGASQEKCIVCKQKPSHCLSVRL